MTEGGDIMTDMPISPAHAKPVSRRDHLWVLAIVAVFALYDVWGAWTELGNKSGFAHGTGWTLTVIVELYWGYAGFAWLAGAPGLRSRRFAMLSAAGVFVLSLVGQGSSYLAVGRTPPAVVVVFVRLLPVTVLALLAVLVHLRHLDRAEAEAAEEEAARAIAEAEAATAAGDERAGLRAQLEALRADAVTAIEALEENVRAAEIARDDAQREAADATAKAGRLTRKLATGSGSVKGRNGRTRQPANGGRKSADTQVPKDVDARAEALALLSEDPAISGAQLAKAVGKSERWGQLLKSELATVPADPEERAS
jgi:hypothetical protein